MSSRIAYAPARNSSARCARVAVIAQAAFVALLSTAGIVFFIAAAFFLAAAMKRVPGWSRLVWPARLVGIAVIALTVALAGAEAVDLGGLFERLLAAVGAAAIAALALRLARTPVP
jgi:hypothetical protein